MKRPVDTLTYRDCQIIQLVADGLLNREIADRLELEIQLVKSSLLTIYDKVGMSSRLELALFWESRYANRTPDRIAI